MTPARPPATVPLWAGIALAVAVLAADQASKWLILDMVMRPPRVIEVTSFFNLVLTWNRGISFGIFNTDSPYNGWILSSLAVGVSAVLAVWMARAPERSLRLALGGIIGGALGNAIDRIRLGAVVDFLDVHAAGLHWPAFNVADSAITLGAMVLMIDALFGSPKSPKK